MHVTATRVRTGDRDISDATIIAEEMYRWFRDTEGFAGFLMLSRQGTTVALTFWESAEVAERSLAARNEFRDRITGIAEVELEEVEDFQLMFGRLPALGG